MHRDSLAVHLLEARFDPDSFAQEFNCLVHILSNDLTDLELIDAVVLVLGIVVLDGLELGLGVREEVVEEEGSGEWEARSRARALGY